MLNVVNCGLMGTKVTRGVANDMVASAKKNLSNWTITGEIENAFSDGMNTVEFVNNGPPSVANGFKQKFYEQFEIVIPDAQAEYIANYWSQYPSYKLYMYKNSNNGYHYVFLGLNWNDSDFLNGSVFVGNGTSSHRTMYKTNTQAFNEWYGPLGYVGQLDSLTKQAILPPYADYQASLPSFHGNITTDFAVEDGKHYLLRFKACSPSRFVKGATDEFIFTSGSNRKAVNIGNAASQTLTEYELMIEADGTTLNIKIDAEMFINANGVELQVSDLRMYEIVSMV